MSVETLKADYPSLEFKNLRGNRFLVTCRCEKKKLPHRRVFEIDEWTESALKRVKEDLDYHVKQSHPL